MYKICGKTWSESDIEQIRTLIVAAPAARRAELARQVCCVFEWRNPGGQLKLMSCRVAMLKMERLGLIKLPAPMYERRRSRETYTSEASDPQPLFETCLSDLEDLKLELVARGKPLALWNEFIARYHYLGYKITLGAQLRYFIVTQGRILGAMVFGGAAWKVAPRDDFIGWTAQEREASLHLIVNQTRFLILPWVRCPNLATKSLAMATRRIREDWQMRYGYRPVLLETFVDTEKFRGTCYKAANWQMVGLTKGRSRMDQFHIANQPIKSIWMMPLTRDFRKALLGRDPSVTPSRHHE